MIARLVAAGTLLMAVGCATVPPTVPTEEVPVHGAGNCDAAAAQGLVGRPATSELGAEVLRLTRARLLRWLQPGQMVTMDFRDDRVNVELDAGNRVTSIRCG